MNPSLWLTLAAAFFAGLAFSYIRACNQLKSDVALLQQRLQLSRQDIADLQLLLNQREAEYRSAINSSEASHVQQTAH